MKEDEFEDDEIEFIDNYQEEQAEPFSEMIHLSRGSHNSLCSRYPIYSETLEEWGDTQESILEFPKDHGNCAYGWENQGGK